MKQPKNSLKMPKSIADTRRIQNKLTTVGSSEKKTCKLRQSYLSRCESESCNVSTFHLFLVYLKFSSNLTLRQNRNKNILHTLKEPISVTFSLY